MLEQMFVQCEYMRSSVRTSLRQPKTKRINLRASAPQERLLRRVAQNKGQTLTEFIVQSACDAAEQESAAEGDFKLSPEKWQAFVEALERPARVHSRLSRLFAEPSILER